MGKQVDGIYSEKKDATIIVPMMATRDADKAELIVWSLTQVA